MIRKKIKDMIFESLTHQDHLKEKFITMNLH